MDLSEQIKKAQNGDSQAFSRIYDAYSGKLFRYIRLKISSRQHAEDILQEVFVKIWRGLPNYDQEKGTFNAWVYRVAANALNDFLRKIYRAPETLEMSEEFESSKAPWQQDATDMGKVLDAELSLKQLGSLMSGIPEVYQKVIEYRFIQDLTVEETAELLGKTNLAVRLIQHRAINKLKKLRKSNNVNF